MIIVEVIQNTQKSPADLMRLAVTQPPVDDQQLTPIEKLAMNTTTTTNNNNLFNCRKKSIP